MNALLRFGRFELLRLVSSWRFLAVTVGFPVVFYMLFLGDRHASDLVQGDIAWRLYLMVAMCSFGALVTAINAGGTRLASERSTGWARQIRVTPLPSWAYVATKVTVSMVVVLPVVVLVEVVGATFGAVHLPAASWVELAAMMWVTSLPFAVIGVFVGFLAHAETAYPVVTVLMFVLGYFGGLFNPVNSMPAALRTVAHALPSFQHAALGLDLVAGQRLGVDHWLVLAAYAVVPAVVIVWRHRVEEARGLA